jgi:hypothetical protein
MRGERTPFQDPLKWKILLSYDCNVNIEKNERTIQEKQMNIDRLYCSWKDREKQFTSFWQLHRQVEELDRRCFQCRSNERHTHSVSRSFEMKDIVELWLQRQYWKERKGQFTKDKWTSIHNIAGVVDRWGNTTHILTLRFKILYYKRNC